ncbi:MAG: CusA/CzcA family heavy metal efflux RND transporter, partial [Cyanobacteria bacterium REEB65]|nr:CusA/CzcA family heavy metal efflux RND transporter [Cyanobacteria bacterium REEB65]
LALLAVVGWGIVAAMQAPVDAIPDLSDNQVIVFTSWPGRSPQVVEDQVTYPLETNLDDLPGVRVVRGSSNFGYSMINVIFDDAIDLYWARTRVLERLSELAGELPAGVTPTLGPDGTGVGQVYWYALWAPGYDLGTLRALQDWYLRLGLQAVPGVAEVASVGGFVRQYQVLVNPIQLYQYGLSVSRVGKAIAASNNEVGGGLVQRNGVEFDVRGLGYAQSLDDFGDIVLKTGPGGIPVRLKDVATVQLGGAERRGAIDWNGKGETVGGIIVMRQGANPESVIARVKAKLADLAKGLPKGVSIVTTYDRSTLIDRAIDTLRHSLVEEAIIVSLVIALFLLHARSALVVILTIPAAVLMAFIAMSVLHVGSNLMSLGGIAIAVGVLVDAGIVMVENAHRHLCEAKGDRLECIVRAAQQVGRPIFASLAIIVLSFVPVFMLTGQEGKLFKPLADTKTFSMAAAAILSITVVPALMTFFLKGRMVEEEKNPVSRLFVGLYRPALAFALRHKGTVAGLAVLAIAAAIPLARSIGNEFMPPLDEGSLLYMPTMLPDVGITEATRLLQVEDRVLKGFPEVASVLGKVGRADTATDPAPISMVETIVNLQPRRRWPAGETKEQLVAKLDNALQIPGVVNAWTQPIINRINMLSTGVRTDL